jgi:hypothetical protein
VKVELDKDFLRHGLQSTEGALVTNNTTVVKATISALIFKKPRCIQLKSKTSTDMQDIYQYLSESDALQYLFNVIDSNDLRRRVNIMIGYVL